MINNAKFCFISAHEFLLAFRVTDLLRTMARGARRALWSLQSGHMGKGWINLVFF